MHDHKARIAWLKDQIRSLGLDAFLVTNGVNVSYLSGFAGEDAMILVTGRQCHFITDSRFAEDVHKTLRGFSIKVVTSTTYETLKAIASGARLRRIGFESMDLPYEVARRLRAGLKPARLVGIKYLVERRRAIKDAEEIALIKKAVACAHKTLGAMAKRLRPGASEANINAYGQIDFIKRGAVSAFGPIVAAGKNSSRPHALAGSTKIKKNSFVMIDLGCKLGGYCSDLTRMFFLGKIKDPVKRIYGIVHHAQARAISMIRPGVRISDVDHAARSFIQEQGYGKYFGHALGHGIGLEVHEQPSISRLSTQRLEAGMVFTVEPAIYVPGLGGVRIEDMVLVTKNGCEVLTR